MSTAGMSFWSSGSLLRSMRMSRSPLDFGGVSMTDPTIRHRQRMAGRSGLPKVLHVTEPRAAMIGWAVIGHQVGRLVWCLVHIDGAPCMTEQPTVHQPAASTRPPRTAWASYAACALALLSAIPSFYWAAGGTIGLDTVGGAIEELARARDPAGVALGIGAGLLKGRGRGAGAGAGPPLGP
jgi:hypothetical protein